MKTSGVVDVTRLYPGGLIEADLYTHALQNPALSLSFGMVRREQAKPTPSALTLIPTVARWVSPEYDAEWPWRVAWLLRIARSGPQLFPAIINIFRLNRAC
jgi:hypothetical protein